VTANGGELELRTSTRDTVAAYMATFVMFASPIAIVYYPGRIGPGAMLISLIAAAIASTTTRLIGAAVFFATFWWIAGMIVSISLDRPLF
jgi:hypothetical protein